MALHSGAQQPERPPDGRLLQAVLGTEDRVDGPGGGPHPFGQRAYRQGDEPALGDQLLRVVTS